MGKCVAVSHPTEWTAGVTRVVFGQQASGKVVPIGVGSLINK